MKSKFLIIAAVFTAFALLFTACPGPGGPTPPPAGDPELTGDISIGGSPPYYVDEQLTAAYSGGESVTYQWKKDGAGVGTNSNRYTPDEPGQYKVTVSKAGYKSKDSAAVTVTYDPARPPLEGVVSITQHQDGPYVGLELTADYTGSETITGYRWEKDGVEVGTDSETYTPDEPGEYTVTVSAQDHRPATSAALTISLRALAGNITIEYDDPYVGKELTAVYDGSEPLSFIYQWKNAAGNVVHEGGTFEPDEEGQYTVTVSAFGYAGKTSASVTVTNDPSLGELSGNISITPHGDGAFVGNELTAVYSGSESVEYQWKKDGAPVGTDSDRHTPDEPGLYTVTVHFAGTNPKTSAGINIALKPLSGTITITGNLLVGKQLTAAYSGTETISTWQWKRGSSLVGGNSNTYTPDEAGSYTVTVSLAGYEPKTSAAVTVDEPEPGTGPTPFAITFNDKTATVRPTTASFTPGGGYDTIGDKEVIGNIPFQTTANYPYPNNAWHIQFDLPNTQDFSGYSKVLVTIGHPLFETQPVKGNKLYVGVVFGFGSETSTLLYNGKHITVVQDGKLGWYNDLYFGEGGSDGSYTKQIKQSIEIPFVMNSSAHDGFAGGTNEEQDCKQLRLIVYKINSVDWDSTSPGVDWVGSGQNYNFSKDGLYIESIQFVK
jgi:hypothetical protein